MKIKRPLFMETSYKESKKRLEKIFNLAERAYDHLFVKKKSHTFKVRPQKFFPKGTTVIWEEAETIGCNAFAAYANAFKNNITVHFYPEILEYFDDLYDLKTVLVHELTHIMQYSADGERWLNSSAQRAYGENGAEYGSLQCQQAFLAFLTHMEFEAMVYQGMFSHMASNGNSTPMEGLETVLNYYYPDQADVERRFAYENAIVNTIPSHPRLRELFAKDPEYARVLHELNGKARELERTARFFVHLRNLVHNLMDEKALTRTVARYKKAYKKDYDPSVFEKMFKRRRKRQNAGRVHA